MSTTLTSSLASMDTINKRLQFMSDNYPDRELFVFYRNGNRSAFTARELFQLAARFSSLLHHKYGFQRNDVIVNTLPNSPERLVTDVGVALAGCISMTGQILLADGSDLIRCAKISKSRAVILRPENDSSAWRLIKQFVSGDNSSDTAKIIWNDLPELTSAIFISRKGYGRRKPFLEQLKESNLDIYIDSSIGPNDLNSIFVTSGSTGYSKLVHRTHSEIFRIGKSLIDEKNATFANEDTALYNDRSFGWAGGFPYTTYTNGQKRVLQDWYDGHGRKKGEDVWAAISKEKCAMAIIRQVDVDTVLKYVEGAGGPEFKLKALATSGQPLTKAQLTSMFLITEKVVVAYASTEGGGLAVGSVDNPNIEDFYCGKATTGVQMKVINEKGEECKAREQGTIFVKGDNIFRGYFNALQTPDPSTVKCFTKDGWFDTEDIGFLDTEGNVYVMGRNKDTITYGSLVLYPGWLEAKINQHPNVVEAYVVPVTDPVIYQNICAVVRKASGSELDEDKLRAYCESIFVADIASEQTPMPKFFLVLDSFPETATGKPDKRRLVELAEQRFGRGTTASK